MNLSQTKLILVADDNPNDAEMTLMALAKTRVPHEVAVACDGVEALDFLRCRGKFEGRTNGNPALVLLDINMPRMNGTEALSEIKGDPQLKTIPIVMFTSSREENDLSLCYNLGANAYVVKPVDFGEFMAAIGKTGVFWADVNEPPPVRPVSVQSHRPIERAIA